MNDHQTPRSEFDSISLSPSTTSLPERQDGEVEIDFLTEILDSCDSHILAGHFFLNIEQAAKVTPWIAWQLGCVAEQHSQLGQHDLAFSVAIYALHSARICNCNERFSANMITAGNVAIRAGRINLAAVFYNMVHSMGLERNHPSQIAAYIGTSNVFEALGDFKSSAHNFEKAYFESYENLNETQKEKLNDRFLTVCAKAEDIAGVFFVSLRKENRDLESAIIDLSKMASTEYAIALDARMRQLGLIEQANKFKSNWLENRRKEDV